jgi:hypothetical protein
MPGPHEKDGGTVFASLLGIRENSGINRHRLSPFIAEESVS